MWREDRCIRVASEFLAPLPRRLAHSAAVAQTVGVLAGHRTDSPDLVAAAWLHDIGYGVADRPWEPHALRGARALTRLGAPAVVVALVAHHTGADCEAEELGASFELAEIPQPPMDALDLLTFADLTTTPDGGKTRVAGRLDEILHRYEPEHPVHRAVIRSRSELEESCRRASAATGYPM